MFFAEILGNSKLHKNTFCRQILYHFPKVSAKNIHYCGQKLGESNITHMISN